MKPRTLLILGCLLLLGNLYLGYKIFFPEMIYVKCKACNGTGKVPCSTETCPDGTMDCPGDCLKKDAAGWTHMHVDGHPDSDIWYKFYYPNGDWSAYNEGHIGHRIELVDGEYKDLGVCPICHGTSRVPCPECQTQPDCPVCHGKGLVAVEKS